MGLSETSKLRAAIDETRQWIEALLNALPGRIGRRLRARWYGRRLKSVGAGLYIDPGVEISGAEGIRLGERFCMMRDGSLRAHDGGTLDAGDRVSINANVCIDASDGGCIRIGNDVLIGPNTVLRASNHAFASRSVPIDRQGHRPGEIVVEDDVWIGANVVIVAGVKIGAHAIVGAGSVVTKEVTPWTIVGGVPAVAIHKRPG